MKGYRRLRHDEIMKQGDVYADHTPITLAIGLPHSSLALPKYHPIKRKAKRKAGKKVLLGIVVAESVSALPDGKWYLHIALERKPNMTKGERVNIVLAK